MNKLENPPITIVFSKPISVLAILVSLIIIYVFLPFLGQPFLGYDSFKMPVFYQILFGFIVLCFGYMLVWSFKKLISIKPAITITSKGIEDLSSPQAVGFIPWDDIKEIRTTRMGKYRTRYISLVLKEPQEYLSRGNLAQSWLRKFNYVFTKSAVLITTNHLNIEFEELMDLISDHLD